MYVINSYLKGRKQRTKINSSYSTFPEILFGVSEASILRSLLFNIYIVNLLFENSDDDIANYADDNPPYTCLSDSDFVIFKLQKNIERIFRWFHNNNLISKAEKCDLIVSFKENLQIKDPSCSTWEMKAVLNFWRSTLIITWVLAIMSINYVRRQVRNAIL